MICHYDNYYIKCFIEIDYPFKFQSAIGKILYIEYQDYIVNFEVGGLKFIEFEKYIRPATEEEIKNIIKLMVFQ